MHLAHLVEDAIYLVIRLTWW